VFGEPINMKK